MTLGQTGSPVSHKAGCNIPAVESGLDLWRIILLLWTVSGILTGAVLHETGAADIVSTSVSADGSVMSSSSYRSGEADITSRLFGSGRTSIDREIGTSGQPVSRLQAYAEGPLLFGEYGQIIRRDEESSPVCVFGNRTEPVISRREIESSGILQHGSYVRDFMINPGYSSVTMNGTGMVSLSHRISRNESLTGRTVANGNLSVWEMIQDD